MATSSQLELTKKPKRRRINSTVYLPYVFLAPTVLLILVFLFYPMLKVFYFSLQTYNLRMPFYNGFVGLGNFVNIFTKDSLFSSSLLTSLKWVVSEVVLQLLIGLGVALVLNQRFKYRGLFRAISFIPWAVSGVLVTTIWSLMYNPFIGVFNDILKKLGVIHGNVGWLSNPHIVFWAVVVAELWRGIPFFSIMLLAALQAIPNELYEAASIDGAGRWDSFKSVTLPYLKDTIILATLLRGVWEFNSVDMIFTMTDGGPANLTTTFPVYIMNQAVNSQKFGYGSALTVIGFVILTIFSLIYLRVSRFGKDELS